MLPFLRAAVCARAAGAHNAPLRMPMRRPIAVLDPQVDWTDERNHAKMKVAKSRHGTPAHHEILAPGILVRKMSGKQGCQTRHFNHAHCHAAQ